MSKLFGPLAGISLSLLAAYVGTNRIRFKSFTSSKRVVSSSGSLADLSVRAATPRWSLLERWERIPCIAYLSARASLLSSVRATSSQ